ncbi:MAG: hypothetical protein CME62_10275 [Halobacteriovoraceae bacterium]|nr:hypothetical protein [Halobacteriovoraceae bacterium]|tara:strand:+ start:2718 stop:2960 length:243 start_codon:yes stop_codon:yes gene_type:complete
MKNKKQNPLYVVKGDQVEQASNLIDMLVKKLNLEPVLEFLISMFKMLFEYAKTYPAFMVVKKMFDELMAKLELFKKFAIL